MSYYAWTSPTGWGSGKHPHVITVEEAAKLVGMHPDTIRAAVRRGEDVGFPVFKAGRRYTVPRASLYQKLGMGWEK